MTTGKGFVRVAETRRYFEFEDGTPFVPFGYNLVRGINDETLADLASSGGNAVRVWLDRGCTGRTDPAAVERLLDLAERKGFLVVFTIFEAAALTDLFAGRCRFDEGRTAFNDVCGRAREVFTEPRALDVQRRLIRFIVDRWGGHPSIFAWELMNQMDGVYEATGEELGRWTESTGAYIRDLEVERWGKAHLRSVSSFDPVPSHSFFYRSPAVDFIAGHMYCESVNAPLNVVDGALHTNRAIRLNLARCGYDRPFLDTENGPLAHLFVEGFPRPSGPDFDEWYHNLIWAGVASGAAGPGFTIPVALYDPPGERRTPWALNALPEGQARYLEGLRRFCDRVEWGGFRSINTDRSVRVEPRSVRPMACSDGRQAVVWLLRDTRVEDAVRVVEGAPAGPGLTSHENQWERLCVLDSWAWLFERTDADPKSWHSRNQIFVLLGKGTEEAAWTAFRKIDESIEKFSTLAGLDPEVSELLERGGEVEPLRAEVEVSGLRGSNHRVVWFDDDDGSVVGEERAAGETVRLVTPPFHRHMALLIEPARRGACA